MFLSTLYWNVNQPKDQWTEHCPEFLLGQSQQSIKILSTKNQDFKRLSWPQVQDLVKVCRTPTWIPRIHIPIEEDAWLGIILLATGPTQWDDTTPSGDKAFSNPADFKILYNDWPYFIDENVAHLVVWTKFFIDEDEKNGEVTEAAKATIEALITRTFCSSNNDPSRKMERNQIVWFKNWRSLKSIHDLGMWLQEEAYMRRGLIESTEHFHIMLYKPPTELLQTITHGDRPGYER
ncbi:uncharacterized protein A1O9_07679 [Exophiala aquamarina CBS 119918]|uniref:Uncharacterized protein n=1 Tax=Exophiala aquamarina CBS 119918 TaxID=1182545 RepID=A0A072P9Z5_9EURO|nr:uncharacterized protein A1O9_07679 [Exophiala aquamarina CBS 119918]KEF56098.1 hypothetical protein A1O9_07679 [Exophiala aquamarina CBS 119918]